jgi:hypothetical protein
MSLSSFVISGVFFIGVGVYFGITAETEGLKWSNDKKDYLRWGAIVFALFALTTLVLSQTLGSDQFFTAMSLTFLISFTNTAIEHNYMTLIFGMVLSLLMQDILLFDHAWGEYNMTGKTPTLEQDVVYQPILQVLFWFSLMATFSYALSMFHKQIFMVGNYFMLTMGAYWIYGGITLFDSVGEQIQMMNVYPAGVYTATTALAVVIAAPYIPNPFE